MGINFSRLLTLKYGNTVANFLNKKYVVISVGRVMTCVLGMVVPQGTRDPGVCENSLLPCALYDGFPGHGDRGRVACDTGIPL